MDQFIELNRTFYELSDYTRTADTDDIDIRSALGLRIGKVLNWEKLLSEHRVILLAEAGSGKTEEMRQAARKIKEQNKAAFFFRLEYLPDGIVGAFDEGKLEDFQSWLSSGEEGWIFLDSVDEARLRDARDFERAIRTLAAQISPALQRTHIVITSRVQAWRPKTDLNLCQRLLPFNYPEKTEDKIEAESDLDEEEFDIDNFSSRTDQTKLSEKNKESEKSAFKIYSISDLTRKQIQTFVQARGIKNFQIFLDEVERQDAWVFTTRPQDLEEIIDYWNKHQRIGTRLELMQHSVERRLIERTQDREVANPLTVGEAKYGATILASATTMMHELKIRVPDGGSNFKGIDAKTILQEWDGTDCLTLLGRPIFDEDVYGCVRFHHRSVSEYLTALWLSEILKGDRSRQKIESLFFRTQYGFPIITPSLKPILSWLILFDQKIREKVFRLEPEIFFGGGDPSRIPLEIRREILNAVCKKLALGISSSSVTDADAVQRFAGADIANDIRRLIKKYKANTEISSFLLRMVWQGRIKQALPETKTFASNPRAEKYVRIAAIRAVKEIGSQSDYSKILTSFLREREKHDRRILAEFINNLDANASSVDWILAALKGVQDKRKYSSDGLTQSLLDFTERLDVDDVAKLVEGLARLLKRKPFVEHRYCEISTQYGWLTPVTAKAIEALVTKRHRVARSSFCLHILTQLPSYNDYEDFESKSVKNHLSEVIPAWPELNHELFWKNVSETRDALHQRKQDRLLNFWQVAIYGSYWDFDRKDFELIANDVLKRSLLDDRLVALSLAFRIYRDNGRPKQWLTQLKKVTSAETELNERLQQLLHPVQSETEKKWKRQEAQWKRRQRERKRKQKENRDKSVKWLKENYAALRNVDETGKGIISRAQWYLHEEMRRVKGNGSMHWTTGDWRSLENQFGDQVATAFRDGLLKFWRRYKPALRSEKDEDGGVPIAIIFGLSGLEAESKEITNWPDALSKEEVELACRYAVWELNGLPDWFPKLYDRHPDTVSSVILKEIEWELDNEDATKDKHYVLNKISWDCQWIWPSISEKLLERLESKEPVNLDNFNRIIKILQGSQNVSDDKLRKLASDKCKSSGSQSHIAYWYAVWIGVEPEKGIKSLRADLKRIKTVKDATMIAMNVIVSLVGERRSRASARELFKTAKHLKDLYILMHEYIRVEEDIDRAGKGAYSPTLRDNAQDARNRLFSLLREIPGKESYLALSELSKSHPIKSHRAWMMKNAKERAEHDGDIPAWTSEQFIDFNKTLEITPINHRELYDLAVQRFLDLKHDLEEGDNSNAPILINDVEEPKIRTYVGGWCRDRSAGRYSVPQEDELADAKRPDLRFTSSRFDGPVPVELKLADNWNGPPLFERLQNQLCGDYLRDNRSHCGVFLLVYRGKKKLWKLKGNLKVDFYGLIDALRKHWEKISDNYPNAEEISIIGIDLTKRTNSRPKTKSNLKKKSSKANRKSKIRAGNAPLSGRQPRRRSKGKRLRN